MSKVGREISNLLSRETEWECTEYRLTHKPTGLNLWIANGAWFFDVDDFKGAIGLIERHWIWWSRARSLIKLFKPHNPTQVEHRAKVWKIIKGSNV